VTTLDEDQIGEEEVLRIALSELRKQLVPETVSSDEELSLEQRKSNQKRDTYAYYGLAMYTAQVFEHEVVNLLVLARIVRAAEKAEDILSDPWEQRFRDTLGQLFKRLKPYLAHDQQLLKDIEEGVRVRNHLAHSYWRVHDEDFLSIRGRAEMITELIEIRDMFADLDERLTRVSKPLRESLGLTDVRINSEYEEAKKRVAERDKGASPLD
jgi:hypothetical protein